MTTRKPLAGRQHHARHGAAHDGAGLDRARSRGHALRDYRARARGAGGVARQRQTMTEGARYEISVDGTLRTHRTSRNRRD
jgi:hypothetical protein